MSDSQSIVRDMFGIAAVKVPGDRPWDIQVHDQRFYPRVLAGGSLGMGETYVEGWWDCERIDEMLARVIRAQLEHKVRLSPGLVLAGLRARLFNMQHPGNAYANVAHYDLGNELFERMLGPTMAYSCGYWREADNLDEAQRKKFDLIGHKLMLAPGQRVLDIGCGFGTLAKHMAERFGCEVVGITMAKEQHAYATRLCAGLPVEILVCDYRDPRVAKLGRFDRIVSVGMFEHVGVKNYRRFMEIAAAQLADDGLFLLHTIAASLSRTIGDAWLTKYFYPNGMLPSPANLTKAMEGLFILEDWHNFGADYDRTLMAWHDNFERYAQAQEFPHDRRFYRLWRYYLLMLAASFRARNKTQLWQVVLSKQGVPGGYRSIR